MINDFSDDHDPENVFEEQLRKLMLEWDQEAKELAAALELPLEARFDALAVIYGQGDIAGRQKEDLLPTSPFQQEDDVMAPHTQQTTLPAPEKRDRDADEKLTQMLRQGQNEAAFASLYERHFSSIYHFLREQTHSAEQAEDLAEETFVKAFSAFTLYSDRYARVSIKAWLFGIARNVYQDSLRRNRREEVFESPFPGDDEWAIDEVDEAMDEVLWQILEVLPPEQREVVRLRFFENLSDTEISRRLGITEYECNQFLHVATQQLRRHFETSRTARKRSAQREESP